ncbi:MAG TPA: methylated-DNA--[protein]-cysteine S-methyltransferase [Syntrophomonadaceae bacterium]|nr:methylated-DNA--[protein]-cysteine S-methyltransferase [Syntrophomonadaceae bacterium]HNX29294.1 methylated-DNA--[protein]-cysteine S-methyltransferase [Syntrophomonadaceae bacterium]HPR92990.1 methylated-DNA--[protein]-cysteine S-methyltransferase [Syntrophomonadaceae bacterium]
MNNIYYYHTDIGRIGIADNGQAITNVFFAQETASLNIEKNETRLINNAAGQIREYLAGKRRIFDLPLKAEGTEFQRKVWQALLRIPYGETSSYQQIAEQIGNDNACRAVGMANNHNPIAIIIPCHRVIGKNGKLVGYGGELAIKARLLEIEKGH